MRRVIEEEGCSLMETSSSLLTVFPVSAKFPHSDLKITFSFVVISSTVAITLKFVNNARTQGRWNFFLLSGKETRYYSTRNYF